MWDLPGPGLEPVSPALAGGFLTTVPPGKSPCFHFLTAVNDAARNILVPVFVGTAVSPLAESGSSLREGPAVWGHSRCLSG